MRVAQRRKALNLSVYKLAAVSQVPAQTIYRIEHGDVDAKVGTLSRLALALHLELWELLAGKAA